MRTLPDPPLAPWSPPDYTVGADGKVAGAVPGAQNNWGRWGGDDQRGAANLLTPERVAAAARLVRTGKRFSLGLPIGGPPAPGSYRAEPLHLYKYAAGDGVLRGDSVAGSIQGSDDYVVMALQASTQIDGFAHVGSNHLLYNGYWAGLVSATGGARRLGVHHLADGIVGRMVLLDVARHLGVAHLEPGFAIGPDELDSTAAAQGVDVRGGDVVLVRTGHVGWRLGEGRGSPATDRDEPGLSVRSVPWLHAHDVAMIATDTTACEVVPPEPGTRFLEFHVGVLRDLGVPIGELFDLDELGDDCATDGVYEGLFVAMPMPIVGGAGSPLNPLAVK